MEFAKFMSQPAGRMLRVVVGVVLAAVGIGLHGVLGVVLILLGIVFVAVGVLNVCLIASLLGVPLSGNELDKESAGTKS